MKGRHFNRLQELSGGEIVLISDGQKTYQYEVYEILKVTAEDVWILENIANDSILTMITCDYTQKPIGRLAVRARLIADSLL
jgi:sortase A